MARPRSFDRDEALLQAMKVFWAVGYERARLTDLQEAMGGITAPSFYAAFGSKEKLFREAVELYSKTLGAPMMKSLADAPTARAAMEQLLHAAVEAFTKPDAPHGCMLVQDAMNSAPVRSLRARRKKLIRQRLARDLPSRPDVAALANFIVTVVDGLAIQARDGASRQTLQLAADCAMAAWDKVVSTTCRD